MRFSHLLVFLLAIGLWSCDKKKDNSNSMLHFHPTQSSFILKTPNVQSLKSAVKNNQLLQKFKTFPVLKSWTSQLEQLSVIAPDQPIVISYSAIGQKNIEFCFTTRSKYSFLPDSISADSVLKYTYAQKPIQSFFFKEKSIHTVLMDSILVGSSSKILIENLIRAKGKFSHPKTLHKLYNQLNSNKYGTLLIHTDKADALLKDWYTNSKLKTWSDKTEWFALDIDLPQDGILLNGIALKNDSIPRYLDLLEDNSNIGQKLENYLPIGIDDVEFYHFSDFKIVDKARQAYLKKLPVQDSLFYDLEELAIAQLKNKSILALSCYSGSYFQKFISENQKGTYMFNGYRVFEMEEPQFISNNLAPLVTNFAASFGCIIEDAYIFTKEKSTLETVLTNYQNGATFQKQTAYIFAKKSMPEEGTLFGFTDGKVLKQKWAKKLQKTLRHPLEKINLQNYHLSTQFIDDNQFFHAVLQVRKNPKNKAQNIISQKFTVTLDADILNTPQFVTNHRNKKEEIVVQDMMNNLYLISSKGKVLWKKALDGPIQGKIHQVDLYKNGKLQLAFTTNNQFLVLDRNGKNVSPFQKTYRGGNLSALAVFDYEKNKNYRFVFTQGNRVHMLNNKAAKVTGFVFTSTKNNLIGVPKHIRYLGKDYLVFRESDGQIHILNRRGQTRIPIKRKFNFSKNPVYWYQNKFSFTTQSGKLAQINTKGKFSIQNIGLQESHFIDATAKSLVSLQDQKLQIKSNSVSLPIGVYTSPKIFYLYDKIYVSTTDLDNQKTYLLDSRGKSIANFPVFGTGPIDLSDMDRNRRLELVVKSTPNTLVVYSLL